MNTAFTYNFDENLKMKSMKRKKTSSPEASDDDLSRSIGQTSIDIPKDQKIEKTRNEFLQIQNRL